MQTHPDFIILPDGGFIRKNTITGVFPRRLERCQILNMTHQDRVQINYHSGAATVDFETYEEAQAFAAHVLAEMPGSTPPSE